MIIRKIIYKGFCHYLRYELKYIVLYVDGVIYSRKRKVRYMP